MALALLEFVRNLRANHFIGLSVFFTDKGFDAVGCEVSKKKDNLGVVEEFRFSDDLSHLVSLVSGRFPVFLQIDGKGVVHKPGLLNHTGGYTSVFPDIDPASFLIQESSLDNGNSFLSVCRKESVFALFDKLSEAGFHVISCILGPFHVNSFVGYIEFTGQEMQLGYSLLSIAEKNISSVSRAATSNQEVLSLQSEKMSADVVLPFCCVLGHVTGLSQKVGELYFSQLSTSVKESKFKKFFYRILGYGLTCMLIIIFVNFIFYTGYLADIEKMEGSYYRNSEMLKQLGVLEKDYQKKRLFVENNDLLGHSDFAWTCDQIGISLPNEIVLEKIDLHPVVGKVRNGKRILYEKGIVRIEGLSSQDHVLSKWVQLLGKEEWIKEVVVERYRHELGSPLTFSVKLVLGKEAEL